MPHFSPMSWILAPALFYFVFVCLKSILWWYQIPKFPSIGVKGGISCKKWSW